MAKKNVNWKKIATEYITSDLSLRAIAEKYKIGFSTVRDRAKREKWTEEKRKQSPEIIKKSVQKSIEKKTDKLAEVNNTHIAICKDVRELIDYYIEELKESAQERKERGLKKCKNNSYALDYLMSAVKKLQQVERTANGMDKVDKNGGGENTEPEIHIINGLEIEKI